MTTSVALQGVTTAQFTAEVSYYFKVSRRRFHRMRFASYLTSHSL